MQETYLGLTDGNSTTANTSPRLHNNRDQEMDQRRARMSSQNAGLESGTTSENHYQQATQVKYLNGLNEDFKHKKNSSISVGAGGSSDNGKAVETQERRLVLTDHVTKSKRSGAKVRKQQVNSALQQE